MRLASVLFSALLHLIIGDDRVDDVNDYTGKYNTQLSAKEEAQFQSWLATVSKKNGRDMSHDLYDYDLRGLWKTNAGFTENGHATDRFKKPNHPTFSRDSQYSGKDGNVGGTWQKDGSGRWTFIASETNLRHYSPEELQRYFKEREPESALVIGQQSSKSLAEILFPNSLFAK